MISAAAFSVPEWLVVIGSVLLGAFVCLSLLRHAVLILRDIPVGRKEPEPPLEFSQRSLIRRMSRWVGVSMLVPVFGVYFVANWLHRTLPVSLLLYLLGTCSLVSLFGALRLLVAKRKSTQEKRAVAANLLLAAFFALPLWAYVMISPRELASQRSNQREVLRNAGELYHFRAPAGMRVTHLVRDGVRDASFWLEAEVPNVSEFARSYLEVSEIGEWLAPSTELPRPLPEECEEWWPAPDQILKMPIYQQEHNKEIRYGSGYRLYFDEDGGKIYGVTYTM